MPAGWQRLERGLPQHDAHLGVLRAAMAIDDRRRARACIFWHQHRAGLREHRRGRALHRDRQLPAAGLVGRGRGGWRAMADVHLPTTLTPALHRPAEHVSRSTRRRWARRSTSFPQRWPGLRDRVCEPGPAIRQHVHVYVDQERAGARHAARSRVPGGRDRRDQRRLGFRVSRHRHRARARPRHRCRTWSRSP